MRRGAKNSSQMAGWPSVNVKPGTVVDRLEPVCRGAHRMRVTAFSFERRELEEKGVSCGRTESRTFLQRREA